MIIQKFERVHPQRRRKMRLGNVLANKWPYLRNGAR